MTETEAVCTGKTLLLTNLNSVIPQLELFFFNTFSFQCSLYFFIDLASKPMESLKQITALDIEKLLSKSAILSENLLLQLWQSLTKEWGAGSISALPEDLVQKHLTEVWFIGNCYYSPIIHITCSMSRKILFKLPFS